MPKIDLPRLITFDGADDTYQYFSTPSWTRPGSDLTHTITIDKSSGAIHCTCEDASCRKKVGDVILKATDVCKHVRELQRLIRAILPAAKEAA